MNNFVSLFRDTKQQIMILRSFIPQSKTTDIIQNRLAVNTNVTNIIIAHQAIRREITFKIRCFALVILSDIIFIAVD